MRILGYLPLICPYHLDSPYWFSTQSRLSSPVVELYQITRYMLRLTPSFNPSVEPFSYSTPAAPPSPDIGCLLVVPAAPHRATRPSCPCSPTASLASCSMATLILRRVFLAPLDLLTWLRYLLRMCVRQREPCRSSKRRPYRRDTT